MKICPTCNTQYTDDTLSYCFNDGTPLVVAYSTDVPAAVPVETETVVRGRQPQLQTAERTQVLAPSARRGANTLVAVVLTAGAMLLLFGIAAWWYLNKGQTEVAVNTSNKSNTANRVSNPPPTPTPKVSPSPTKTPADPAGNVPAPADDSQMRGEVRQTLDDWKSQAEALELDSYMDHYADTVDYYKKNGASLAFVRSDKERAFSRYDSIRVDLSNMSITTDSSKHTVTVIFDKEWDFEGDGNSSGKVQQMMRLRKIDGQWLITAEKDLRVYYTR